MGNTTDIEEKAVTELEQADVIPQETYHVLTFIKAHTSTFLAILSGVVTVAAFLLNLIAYVYQRIKLNPWHIDGDVIEFWGNQQFILSFSLELVYILLIYAVPLMLSRSFIYYYRLMAIFKYWKAWIRNAKAEQRKMRKEIRATQKELKKCSSEATKGLFERLQKIEMSLAKLKKELSEEMKNSWMMRGLALVYIGTICFLAALMFIPVVVLMTGITGEIDWKTLLLFWGVAALLSVIGAQVKAKQLNEDCRLKVVRRDVKKIMNGDEAYQKLQNKAKEMRKKLKEHTPTIRVFDDGTLKEWGCRSLLAMGMMMLFLCTSAMNMAYEQKDFWIYTDAAQTYAVAYQDGNHCVLKQATLNGNEIIIHTGEQLVVSGTVATSQKAFDKVTFEK